MLILHAAQVKGDLVLWSEDSGTRLTPPDRQTAGKHPYCAQAQLLAEAAGFETDDNSFAIAWLPSRGDAPAPSSPMAGPMPKSRAQAPHQAMDRNNAPAEAGASRPAAEDVRPAAGPETRRRHRNGPGLLGTRPAAGSLPDGPAAIPAQPVRTGRTDRGGMDSGVHR